ncbi:hypothetical protein A989_18768 [Xanthomonas translucens DAR61454]|nr:hypothetical protein A989_18768 [Xanthomonas translucens DAR61454]
MAIPIVVPRPVRGGIARALTPLGIPASIAPVVRAIVPAAVVAVVAWPIVMAVVVAAIVAELARPRRVVVAPAIVVAVLRPDLVGACNGGKAGGQGASEHNSKHLVHSSFHGRVTHCVRSGADATRTGTLTP